MRSVNAAHWARQTRVLQLPCTQPHLADRAVRGEQAELVPEEEVRARVQLQAAEVPEAIVGEEQRPARLADVDQQDAFAAAVQAADEWGRIL